MSRKIIKKLKKLEKRLCFYHILYVKIVENYFTNLAAEHIHLGMYSAIVESLSGILSDSDLEKFAREKNGQISCSES